MNVDIETCPSADTREVGAYAYVSAPSFEILLIGCWYDGQDVEVTDLTDPSMDPERDFPDFREGLYSPGVIRTICNANFERTCPASWLSRSIPPEQWRYTAIRAVTLGLPGTLGRVGEVLGLSEDKQKDKIGKSLIQCFCKPCKPAKINGMRSRDLPGHAPDKWQLFTEHNRQDVVAEAVIREKLQIYPVTKQERELRNLGQHINNHGVRPDMDLADKIIQHDGIYQEQSKQEARKLTGLNNPNSLSQLKMWFFVTYELDVPSITKDSIPMIEAQLKELKTTHDVLSGLRMLRTWKELGKTSVGKHQTMGHAVCPDGYPRGIPQFYGVNRTGCWIGRIMQAHNLPQNKIPNLDLARDPVKQEDLDTLELLFEGIPFVFLQFIRAAFIPSEGCRSVVSDFSTIEARVIAWLTDEEWRLDMFRTHGKIYEVSAAQMFHVPIENTKKGNRLRQQGKVAEFALGYDGGSGAIRAMDRAGIVSDDEISMIIANWRKVSLSICRLWRNTEAAVYTAIEERRIIRLKHDLSFSYINKILFTGLPPGRELTCYDTQIEDDEKGKNVITYAGVDQEIKKWGRPRTWGEKLAKSITQATIGDCLAVIMGRVSGTGYQIVIYVRDGTIVDAPGTDIDTLEKITTIVAQSVPWA